MSRVALQRVFVRGLRLEASIGVHPHEHGRTQPILIDVELDAELALDGRLESTINYAAVGSAAKSREPAHIMMMAISIDCLRP